MDSIVAEKDAEIARLRAKVAAQAWDAKIKDRVLHEKNVALDGMAWVWCTGGCKSGTGRFTDLDVTEEMVVMVERNAKRLRQRFTNLEGRRRAALEQ